MGRLACSSILDLHFSLMRYGTIREQRTHLAVLASRCLVRQLIISPTPIFFVEMGGSV